MPGHQLAGSGQPLTRHDLLEVRSDDLAGRGEVGMAAGRVTTVLWDIDGTLLRSGAVAARAFLDAVTEVTGIRPSAERRDYGGRLDTEIADMLLTAVGAQPARITEVLVVLERLVTERLDDLRAQTRALPGVE